jgi:hypothetical protein
MRTAYRLWYLRTRRKAINLLQVTYTHQLLMRDTMLSKERKSKTESSAEYDARQREMVDELKELMKPGVRDA